MSEEIQEQLYVALEASHEAVIADTGAFATAHQLEHDATFVGAVKSLEARDIVVATVLSTLVFTVTAEGADYAANGTPEARVFAAVSADPAGTPLAAINAQLGAAAKIGCAQAFKSKWLKNQRTESGPCLHRLVASVDDTVATTLAALVADASTATAIPDDVLAQLKRRKLIQQSVVKTFKLVRGPMFATFRRELITEITMDNLRSGEWEAAAMKPYNWAAAGKPPAGGHKHPLLQVRSDFREVFFSLGFTEMPTDRWVESSFWNFDALFQPQQHPARDMHDTFFVKGAAARTHFVPADYEARVKATHEDGWQTGSIGWRYDWSGEEARKQLLRTHTTAVSARMLRELGRAIEEDGEEFRPHRFFSIDRVFRNETLDATHLCEFQQVEGVLCMRDLTVGHLMATIKAFFQRIGMPDVRFKPCFNPYTEPSMEVFAFHPGLDKWVEVGNSGIFRPEMLVPMGLPADVRVAGWGLSLERPTMIKWAVNNIRELVGHQCDLELFARSEVCRLDA
jgi:phenylalanyl-tRNA synthetase alpha chain